MIKNFEKFKEIDSFEEEDWGEIDIKLIEYRIFNFTQSHTNYILIGEYYNNNKINLLSNTNNNISFNGIFNFDFDYIFNNSKTTSNSIEKIINGEINLTLAGDTEKKYKFENIKKYLNPKIKINFI